MLTNLQNAPEKRDFKTKMIAMLDAKARPDVIIVSSTPGIPSSQFVGDCKNDTERGLIGHPFNPPHLMPFVEVVPHPGATTQAVKNALEFHKFLGKTPIHLQ